MKVVSADYTKRLIDLFFSLIAFILGFPVFLTIAVVIWLSSPGPVIFKHQRIGKGGRPFYCYKFRTMYQDAQARLDDLLASCPQIKCEWESSFKLKNDPRVTPIGRFLRKSSLDELPQFWNVLKGDMSVVGPRPMVQEEIDRFVGDRAEKLLSVRPGITGLWQVSGRNDISYDERLELENQYIDRLSLALDLKLIGKTFKVIFAPRGAY
jgi:undecaprenyl-phosphate galactose phosphotransferase